MTIEPPVHITSEMLAPPIVLPEIVGPPILLADLVAHPIQEPGDAAKPALLPVANSTDATRGEPLGVRAQKRKAELELALEKVPTTELRARRDIELALASVSALMTGDLEHLTGTTGADISRWLENTKHLAEATPTVPAELADSAQPGVH